MPSKFNDENDKQKIIKLDKRRENKNRVNETNEKKDKQNNERTGDASQITDKRSDQDRCVENKNKIRVRKETLKMITKSFEPKEMLPFSQLRKLNQKDLLRSLEQNDKLGIVVKDQLKVAMIDMDKYQMMVDALQEYERLLDLLEERELYEQIGHRLESNRVVEYKEGKSLLELAGIHPGR